MYTYIDLPLNHPWPFLGQICLIPRWAVVFFLSIFWSPPSIVPRMYSADLEVCSPAQLRRMNHCSPARAGTVDGSKGR